MNFEDLISEEELSCKNLQYNITSYKIFQDYSKSYVFLQILSTWAIAEKIRAAF